MKTKVQIGIWLLVVLIAGTACKKDEGKGGKISIKGKLYAKYYNKTFTTQRYEGYAPDEDVFLMYGDEVINGDDMKTSYDGSYEFKYLTKGKYKVYAYSVDPATQEKIAVVKEVELSKDDVTLDDIIVNKEDKSYGTFAIRGKVRTHDWDDSYFIEEYTYMALDEDVFLIEEGDSSFVDKVSTNHEGMYEFRGLRKGKYTVYVISDDGFPGAIEGFPTPGGLPDLKEIEIVDSDLMLSEFNIHKN
jgi:hypothetical protein